MTKPSEMKQDRIAIDRASARTFDEDGHLHVRDVPISKANVCPYYGHEIPDGDVLGLDPNRVYNLLRDPAELEKAADSFNGKPLLNLHRAQTADDFSHDLTVGAVHNVYFKSPYLYAGDFSVWDSEDIASIESDEKSQISSSYRYKADMTPGNFEGARYDGVMRNIRGNHVALVDVGRAGPDVVVSDAALVRHNQEITMATKATVSRQALLASGALRVYLKPKLAADAKLELAPILKGITAKSWKTDKAKIKTALDAAVKGKLAADADIEDVVEMLDQLEEVAEVMPDVDPVAAVDPVAEDDDADVIMKLKGALKEKGLSDEDIEALIDGADPVATAADVVPVAGVTKAAMDAAIRSAAIKAANDAETATIARLRSIQAAERDVRPFIGDIAVAQDSAASVYKLALDHLKVDLTGVPPEGYGALLRAMPNPSDAKPVNRIIAADAAAVTAREKRFPNATRLSTH